MVLKMRASFWARFSPGISRDIPTRHASSADHVGDPVPLMMSILRSSKSSASDGSVKVRAGRGPVEPGALSMMVARTVCVASVVSDTSNTRRMLVYCSRLKVLGRMPSAFASLIRFTAPPRVGSLRITSDSDDVPSGAAMFMRRGAAVSSGSVPVYALIAIWGRSSHSTTTTGYRSHSTGVALRISHPDNLGLMRDMIAVCTASKLFVMCVLATLVL